MAQARYAHLPDFLLLAASTTPLAASHSSSSCLISLSIMLTILMSSLQAGIGNNLSHEIAQIRDIRISRCRNPKIVREEYLALFVFDAPHFPRILCDSCQSRLHIAREKVHVVLPMNVVKDLRIVGGEYQRGAMGVGLPRLEQVYKHPYELLVQMFSISSTRRYPPLERTPTTSLMSMSPLIVPDERYMSKSSVVVCATKPDLNRSLQEFPSS